MMSISMVPTLGQGCNAAKRFGCAKSNNFSVDEGDSWDKQSGTRPTNRLLNNAAVIPRTFQMHACTH
jgi:hypothetical protein